MRYLKILFTGDICFEAQHEMNAELAKKVLAPMREILSAADLRVMNLETPLADEGVGAPIEKRGPAIIGRPENVGFLTEAGCDIAILANNHTGDYGPDALFSTIDILDRNKILHTGAGKDIDEAYKAVRINLDGIRISFLGICENEFGIAEDDTPGTAGFELDRAGNVISGEKEASDYVIVVFHGGNERNPLPSPGCRSRYRTLIRLGADAVIGGHPHCMQGYEYFLGKPIVYSGGNFFFKDPENTTLSWLHGYITELTIGERLTVRPIPYEFTADGLSVIPLSGNELSETLSYIEEISSYIPDTKRLNELFDCWSVTYGFGYPKRFAGSDGLAPGMNDAAFFKNNLICEAHNEVCRTAYRIMFENRLDEALSHKPELDRLKAIPCERK